MKGQAKDGTHTTSHNANTALRCTRFTRISKGHSRMMKTMGADRKRRRCKTHEFGVLSHLHRPRTNRPAVRRFLPHKRPAQPQANSFCQIAAVKPQATGGLLMQPVYPPYLRPQVLAHPASIHQYTSFKRKEATGRVSRLSVSNGKYKEKRRTLASRRVSPLHFHWLVPAPQNI